MKAAARKIRDAQVAQVYAGNQSLRSTAKLFGISHEGVRKILTTQGVEIAPPHTWNNPVGALAPRCADSRSGVTLHLTGTLFSLPGRSGNVECPGRSSSPPTGAN